jgi:hypothetical protein
MSLARTAANFSARVSVRLSALARASDKASGWQRDFTLIVLPALVVFAVCIVDQNMFADGDTNWHVATGRWILAHGGVPATDPFSFTAIGYRWVTHEWLTEVLMALAYNGGGWSGVMVLTAAAAAASTALMAAELRRRLGAFSVVVCLGLALAVLLPHLLARPHLITLPLLIVWTVQLLEARREDRTPPLWLLPLMALWANLHGSFIFGLAFACVFALEAFLAARGRRLAVAAKWGAFLIAATLMALITPNGVAGLTYPVYVMSMKNLQSIGEWHPANLHSLAPLQVALLFTLFVCLYRGVRMGAVRVGLLLLVFYMTLQHNRQEVILAVVAPLLLAEPRRPRNPRPEGAPGRTAPDEALAWPPLRQIAAPAAVAALLFLSLGVWRLATPEARKDRATVPVTALAHVPAALRARPVFNEYSFGGWLVFKGVRDFMDGRSDMFGDNLLKLYLDIAGGDQGAMDKAFARYGIVWTIMPPSSALVKKLDATPGWRRLYADKWAVVQVRRDASAR